MNSVGFLLRKWGINLRKMLMLKVHTSEFILFSFISSIVCYAADIKEMYDVCC
jgi:hypothetical protein